MLKEKNKLWYLSKIKLFDAMNQADMEHMERITRMEETPKYSPLYLPGDPASSIYFLKKGQVRISSLSEEGKQITHSILVPGNIFGELSLIEDDGAHDNMAEAIEDTMVCIVHKKDFEAFLETHPQLNLKITKLIGLRLRQVTSRIQDLVFKTAEQRLETLLHQLGQEHGVATPEGTLIQITLTHQDLGELTNIARPTVTTIMQHFQTDGKIRVHKRKIILLQNQSV